MTRKLRMGMIGGGPDAFIGAVHKMAAELDGHIELVSGAFGSTPERSVAGAERFHLPREKAYANYQDMFKRESLLPEDERIDFVAVATPNHLHYPVAMTALSTGFPVVCEKPMTLNLSEARRLEKKVQETGLPFCLMHNYSGYPMVREARELVRAGKLGALRRIVVEFPQGWLSTLIEETGQKQAAWRTNPKEAGPSNCMADIGTHAAHLAEFISGQEISEVCADLATFVEGRQLEDDVSVLLRFAGGARGVLWASQVATGEEADLNIRVYGTRGSLAWRHEQPGSLVVRWLDRPTEIRRAGLGAVSGPVSGLVRLPAGHPEGYIEAFANLYREFARALRPAAKKRPPEFPGVLDGVRGMALIEAVIRSSGSRQKWVRLPL